MTYIISGGNEIFSLFSGHDFYRISRLFFIFMQKASRWKEENWWHVLKVFYSSYSVICNLKNLLKCGYKFHCIRKDFCFEIKYMIKYIKTPIKCHTIEFLYWIFFSSHRQNQSLIEKQHTHMTQEYKKKKRNEFPMELSILWLSLHDAKVMAYRNETRKLNESVGGDNLLMSI